MKHELLALPYAIDALAPHISQETLEYHHGKHLQTYVDNLNNLLPGTEFENMALEEMLQYMPKGPLFNNAAQVFNHNFYFQSLAPESTKPSKELLEKINEKWTSLEKFQEEFNKKALANFGSGWTWLTFNEFGELEIINTDDADTLAVDKVFCPLLVCDVWEHAYYIDTRNARAKYLENFWKVVNWKKVDERFASHK